jgi:hypothetical protein
MIFYSNITGIKGLRAKSPIERRKFFDLLLEVGAMHCNVCETEQGPFYSVADPLDNDSPEIVGILCPTCHKIFRIMRCGRDLDFLNSMNNFIGIITNRGSLEEQRNEVIKERDAQLKEHMTPIQIERVFKNL